MEPRSRACGTAVFVLLRTKCARGILKVAIIVRPFTIPQRLLACLTEWIGILSLNNSSDQL